MNKAQLINQDSGKTEYYTPQEIIEAARTTMGGISLDPASSIIANLRVRADAWFGIDDNSLGRAWCDNAWLNHPFSRKGNPLWINKLIREHEIGNVKQACCITFAATSEKWFQPLSKYAKCWLSPRTNYFKPDGTLLKGVTKGSVVTYFGPNIDKFASMFASFGTVTIPYKEVIGKDIKP